MLAYQLFVLLALLGFLAITIRNLKDYSQIPTCSYGDLGKVAVLIPARNEAANIAQCLQSIVSQDYEDLVIYVLDDQSDDGTDRIVEQVMANDPRVALIHGEPKPNDWAGKVWACSQLGTRAIAAEASWLLFIDADTCAAPSLVSSLVQQANDRGASMTTTFPSQLTGTFWECVAMPVLHFLITTFLPIRLVDDPQYPTVAAGCGQVELFTSAAYVASGGHTAVQHSFHDGLQLARLIKRSNLRVLLCDASHLITCRMYHSGEEVWNGFTRNAYEGVGSLGALIAITLTTIVFFILPFGFIFAGIWLQAPPWLWVCAFQVAVIALIRIIQARRFGHLSSVWLHPLSMLLLVAVQWSSYFRFRFGGPTNWKGRKYEPGDLSSS